MNVRPGLASYPHDPSLVARLSEALSAGELDARVGVLRPDPLEPDDVVQFPGSSPAGAGATGLRESRGAVDPEALSALRASGRAALAQGEVAVAILAGGMATRFGGVAKATVPLRADDATTFLSWQLRRIAAHRDAGGRIPVAIVVSFATHDAVLAHLDAIDWGGVPPEDRLVVTQSFVPRHAAGGGLLSDDPEIPDGLAYAAPGHGEVLTRLRESGTVDRLGELGVRHVVVTNCDNLGATLDAAGVGFHVEGGAELTIEIVARAPGDRGGPIARVRDRPVVVEGFRLSPDVDVERFAWFNTNTLWFRLDALRRPLDLDWFAVRRSITLPDGSTRAVVQTEQLIGQASEHCRTRFAGVERARRFVPIKTREDLARAADVIARRLADPELSER